MKRVLATTAQNHLLQTVLLLPMLLANNGYPAGPYGNTACDAPVSLEDSMFAAINSIAPNAAFTIFTGDIVDHARLAGERDSGDCGIQDAYSHMASLPHVYTTAGNHEASPVKCLQSCSGQDLAGHPVAVQPAGYGQPAYLGSDAQEIQNFVLTPQSSLVATCVSSRSIPTSTIRRTTGCTRRPWRAIPADSSHGSSAS